ncbi:MAG: hypothetical protein EOP06_02615 [Proteobacteria bacterium]|nr:MAG: hypothetical protein EOP06_02615 [Pseudomonadota bacterium]
MSYIRPILSLNFKNSYQLRDETQASIEFAVRMGLKNGDRGEAAIPIAWNLTDKEEKILFMNVPRGAEAARLCIGGMSGTGKTTLAMYQMKTLIEAANKLGDTLAIHVIDYKQTNEWLELNAHGHKLSHHKTMESLVEGVKNSKSSHVYVVAEEFSLATDEERKLLYDVLEDQPKVGVIFVTQRSVDNPHEKFRIPKITLERKNKLSYVLYNDETVTEFSTEIPSPLKSWWMGFQEEGLEALFAAGSLLSNTFKLIGLITTLGGMGYILYNGLQDRTQTFTWSSEDGYAEVEVSCKGLSVGEGDYAPSSLGESVLSEEGKETPAVSHEVGMKALQSFMDQCKQRTGPLKK